MVSVSEPPELPEPEVEYRRPARIEPPADVVPGIVPVELLAGPLGDGDRGRLRVAGIR